MSDVDEFSWNRPCRVYVEFTFTDDKEPRRYAIDFNAVKALQVGRFHESVFEDRDERLSANADRRVRPNKSVVGFSISVSGMLTCSGPNDVFWTEGWGVTNVDRRVAGVGEVGGGEEGAAAVVESASAGPAVRVARPGCNCILCRWLRRPENGGTAASPPTD